MNKSEPGMRWAVYQRYSTGEQCKNTPRLNFPVYSIDSESGKICVDPINAEVLTLFFELYASGKYSVKDLRQALHVKSGRRICPLLLRQLLINLLYVAKFRCSGLEFEGTKIQHKDCIQATVADESGDKTDNSVQPDGPSQK